MKIEFDTASDSLEHLLLLKDLIGGLVCQREEEEQLAPLPELSAAPADPLDPMVRMSEKLGLYEQPPQDHDLYTDADRDRPDVVCDRNGRVVRAPCKRCGKGEAQLDGPCVPMQAESPAQPDPLAGLRAAAGVSFTPGDLSGAAPSGADAAQSPTAPEAPTAGVPVPPSAASAPATAHAVPPVPAAPSSPAGAVELDVNGLPWDERIHAGSKAKNADGSWRQRRNLSPATLEAVTAQLKGAPQAVETQEGRPESEKMAGAAGWLAAETLVPPPPVPPVPAVPVAAAAGVTTQQFMEWLTPQMMAGKVTFAQVAEALKEHGMTSLGQLSTAPEHAGKADAVYRSLGGE